MMKTTSLRVEKKTLLESLSVLKIRIRRKIQRELVELSCKPIGSQLKVSKNLIKKIYSQIHSITS